MATVKHPSNRTGTVIGGATLAGVLALAALFVKPWEGRELQPYQDIVKVWTVCDGHTGRSTGAQINLGRTYTHEECDQLLSADLGIALGHVTRCITAPATDYQLAAMTSAAFNIGPRVVCGSTLQRKANAGDWSSACAELDRWIYAGGKRVRGLERRRAAERALCEGQQI